MLIDTTTEIGARVERRLREEPVIWLTTVRDDSLPQPSPVWFLWDGASVLIYSRPDTPKLRNIARRPRVALNLDGDGRGGNIIVISGQALIDADALPAHQVPGYAEKYRPGIERIGMTPEQFSQAYSVAVRVTPTAVRGH